MVTRPVETSAVDRLVERWIDYCADGLAVGLVYLGDRLGLFTALRDGGLQRPRIWLPALGWWNGTSASGWLPPPRRVWWSMRQPTSAMP
jgi:hypothetical protein